MGGTLTPLHARYSVDRHSITFECMMSGGVDAEVSNQCFPGMGVVSKFIIKILSRQSFIQEDCINLQTNLHLSCMYYTISPQPAMNELHPPPPPPPFKIPGSMLTSAEPQDDVVLCHQTTLLLGRCGLGTRRFIVHDSDGHTIAGPPSSPSNLSYNFSTTCNDTHIPVTFSWSLPTSENMDYHPPEVLVLSYRPAGQGPELMELTHDVSNATVFMLYSIVYDVILYATSCGGSLQSKNISISINLPEYQGIITIAR